MNSNLDEGHAVNNMNKIRGAFDSIFQRVKRVFACSYDDADSNGGFKVGTLSKAFSSKSEYWKLQHWKWWE